MGARSKLNEIYLVGAATLGVGIALMTGSAVLGIFTAGTIVMLAFLRRDIRSSSSSGRSRIPDSRNR